MIARTVSRIVTRQISRQVQRLTRYRLAVETLDDTHLEAIERDIIRFEQTGIMPPSVIRLLRQMQGAERAERPHLIGQNTAA